MVYWFPIRFLEHLNPRLRRIARTFLHDLGRCNEIDTLIDMDDFDWVCDWVEDSSEDSEEREATLQLIESYRSGPICRQLELVVSERPCKNLRAALARYTATDEREERLVALMKEGLEFTDRRRKGIMEFAYDYVYEQDPDEYPIALEQQIRFIYDDDRIAAYLMDGYTSNREARL